MSSIFNILPSTHLKLWYVTLHFNRNIRGIWTKGPPLIKIQPRGDPWVQKFLFAKFVRKASI